MAVCLCPDLVDADVLEAGQQLPGAGDVLLALLVLDGARKQALHTTTHPTTHTARQQGSAAAPCLAHGCAPPSLPR